jgi:hypothetical protein
MKSLEFGFSLDVIELSLVVVLSDFPLFSTIDDVTDSLAISVFAVDIDRGNITVRCINHALLLGEIIFRNSFEELGVAVPFTYCLIEFSVTGIVWPFGNCFKGLSLFLHSLFKANIFVLHVVHPFDFCCSSTRELKHWEGNCSQWLLEEFAIAVL